MTFFIIKIFEITSTYPLRENYNNDNNENPQNIKYNFCIAKIWQSINNFNK